MTNLLTTADAAKILNTDRKAVVALLEKGQIKGKKVGRGWLVDPTSVIAYQQKHQSKSID